MGWGQFWGSEFGAEGGGSRLGGLGCMVEQKVCWDLDHYNGFNNGYVGFIYGGCPTGCLNACTCGNFYSAQEF